MEGGLYKGEIITSIMVFDRQIKGVKNLETIRILPYTKANDKKIADLIKLGKIDEIPTLSPDGFEQNDGYDLLIYKFFDDKDHEMAAVVYDSDDLAQKPQILELFLLH